MRLFNLKSTFGSSTNKLVLNMLFIILIFSSMSVSSDSFRLDGRQEESLLPMSLTVFGVLMSLLYGFYYKQCQGYPTVNYHSQ